MPTDEEAIRNLIGLHSQLTDDGDYERRVELYTEDGVFAMGDAISTGREEIVAAFAATSAPERRGKHITANTVMDIDGDTASVQTDFFFSLPSADGLKPLAAGRYFDTFVKVGGRWLYRERRITFLGHSVPSDLQLKTMNTVHRAVLKVSGGRLGWHAARMPVIELTTTGRKSGAAHTVMLTSPVQDGSALVVVASRGGDDAHPAWFLNLQSNPRVEVSLQGGPKTPMRARVATAEERAELWPRVTADHKNYAGYQTKTAREIPLVILEPEA